MPKHVVNFRYYEFFIMLIMGAYALNNQIVSIVQLHNKRPCLNIVQLTFPNSQNKIMAESHHGIRVNMLTALTSVLSAS